MKTALAGNRPAAIATVVETWGSSPRPVGSWMLLTADGLVHGSVSGGCVEGAVIEAARAVAAGQPPRLLTFGVADADAWTVGLSCGGRIRVWVQRFDPGDAAWSAFVEALESNRPMVLWQCIDPEAPERRCLVPGNPDAPDPGMGEASGLVEDPAGRPWFGQVFPGRDRLILVGASHIAIALVRLATGFGIETHVIDPRKTFAAPERFDPPPDSIQAVWPEKAVQALVPDARTSLVCLSHDPKIDDPALEAVRATPVAYIGALGSRSTHRQRLRRLADAGWRRDELARIDGPAGLDIGALTPAEIALSILAAVVRARRGGPRWGEKPS
ncbi:MAG: XdhC family protein [Opitutales bacterium]